MKTKQTNSSAFNAFIHVYNDVNKLKMAKTNMILHLLQGMVVLANTTCSMLDHLVVVIGDTSIWFHLNRFRTCPPLINNVKGVSLHLKENMVNEYTSEVSEWFNDDTFISVHDDPTIIHDCIPINSTNANAVIIPTLLACDLFDDYDNITSSRLLGYTIESEITELNINLLNN
jgi:hypothetical protein